MPFLLSLQGRGCGLGSVAELYKGAANILAVEGYLDGYSAFQARNAILIYAQRVRVINPVREAFGRRGVGPSGMVDLSSMQ